MMNREDYALMGPMALMQHCEALERDAARYRYLRGTKALQGDPTFFPYAVIMFENTDAVMPLFAAALDEAVDRAIRTGLTRDASPDTTEAEIAAQRRLKGVESPSGVSRQGEAK